MQSSLLSSTPFVGALLIALMSAHAPVQAAIANSSNVSGSCVGVSVSSITFGSYDPTAKSSTGNLDVTDNVSIRCTAGSSNVLVSLDEGLHADVASTPSDPQRRMRDTSGNYVSYDIYQEDQFSRVWAKGGSADNQVAAFSSSLVP